MDKKEFEKWVVNKLNAFAHELPNKKRPWIEMSAKLNDKKSYLFTHMNSVVGNFLINCDVITRETTIFNTSTKRYATAKCRIGEIFSPRIGVAIAWAKYNHEVVPDWANSIPREELVNGDKFISSINKNNTFVFIGWIPDMKDGLTGKWAIAIDDYYKPIKTQIAKEVVKIK